MAKRTIPIEAITPNPGQPRKHFAGLEELAASIKQNGLLEPITVRPMGSEYEIICGERRWRACKLAGLVDVAVTIREATDEESRELAIIENVQRQDLTPMEEAECYAGLQADGYTQTAIAAMIGKTQTYVAHKVKLFRIPEPVTFYLREGALTENHIRQLARLERMYGTHVTVQFDPAAVAAYKVTTPEEATALLLALRPEGRVFGWPADELQVMACAVLQEYVSKHNAQTPQWVIAAWWWASLAVACKLGVADLSLALENWHERYSAARWWWASHGPDGIPKDRKEADLYWGYRSDLRQSSSLDLDELSPENEPMFTRFCEQLMQAGSYPLPSTVKSPEPASE